MQVDWFTVVAQIVNFLILVYLLKRFLYGPVVSAMERREERVTGRLRDARQSQDEAERKAAELQRERDELEARRQELLDEAREQADERRRQLLDEIRDEVEEVRERWRQDVEREKEAFVRDLRGEAASWIAAAARRALSELADAELEDRIVGVFAERLRKLSAEEGRSLAEAVRDGGEPLRVVTTFSVPEPQREALREAIQEQLGEEIELRFAESADLVCGIELRTPGRVVAWSVDGFLGDLGERLEDALEQVGRRDREPTGSEGGAGGGAARHEEEPSEARGTPAAKQETEADEETESKA